MKLGVLFSLLLALILCLGTGRATEATTPPPPPPPEAAPLLLAIRERRVVSFEYEGRRRVAEPQAIGIASSGDAILLAFQTGGDSASGRLPGWRTFTLAKITALETTTETFPGPRPPAKNQPRLSPTWAEVPPAEPAAK